MGRGSGSLVEQSKTAPLVVLISRRTGNLLVRNLHPSSVRSVRSAATAAAPTNIPGSWACGSDSSSHFWR
uniref:Uncharacterized protein n=1 Tax=Anopheles dirus TaxID=7168 RepID=A0A182NYE8_9DIPT